MDYINCKLFIGSNDNNEQLKYEDSEGRNASGEVGKDDLIRMTVKTLNEWVAEHDDCSRRGIFEILGMHLYNLLFPVGSKIRNEFETTYRVFDNKNKEDLCLQLSLIFHAKAMKTELASYPWEFIFMPWNPKGFFLAGEKTKLILTRAVPEIPGIPKDLQPEGKPLRILIIVSHPTELGVVDADALIKDIKALDKPKHIEVKEVDYSSRKKIGDAVNTSKPHILHFIGHGKAGKIALMKTEEEIEAQKAQNEKLKSEGKKPQEIKEADWIDSRTMSDFFDKHQPRLVFLHACQGAADSLSTLRSTAIELVYSKIPAVVAMQYEISNGDALAFARKFYQQIGEGQRIDEAVREARYELGKFPCSRRGAWDDRCFGAPVIYLLSENPIISLQASPPLPTQDQCPQCGNSVLYSHKVCSKCRCKLMQCPSCGRIIAHGSAICPYCECDLESSSARPEDETRKGGPKLPVDTSPGPTTEQTQDVSREVSKQGRSTLDAQLKQ